MHKVWFAVLDGVIIRCWTYEVVSQVTSSLVRMFISYHI